VCIPALIYFNHTLFTYFYCSLFVIFTCTALRIICSQIVGLVTFVLCFAETTKVLFKLFF